MVAGVFIFASIALCALGYIETEDDVWVLTEDNFQEALDLQPDLLVEFYAPWCGHCKKLAPEYSSAAKKLMNNQPPIRIAKVDATVNTNLASTYGVSGYPTLKYFVNKSPIDYTGGRTEETIVQWVQKKNTPSLSVFSSETDLKKFLEAQKIVVVLFAQKNSDAASAFEVVSKQFDNVYFAISLDPSALDAYKVSEPSLVIFRTFDEKRVDFSGDLTQTAIADFVNSYKLPLVIPFGDDAVEEIFKKGTPGLFLFSNSYLDYQNSMESISKEYRGNLVVTFADPRNPDNKRLTEYFGISADDQASLMIFDTKTSLKYRYSGDIYYKSAKGFIEDWKNKKIEPYVKSQEIPSDPYDNGVRVLVAKNFDEVVFDNSKDVLVEVYAPWCGHCKKLAPEYERFANELRDNQNIVIAKIDGSANDIKAFEVKGFPTLKFFAAKNKKPVDFNGDRDFNGLMKFIKEKATSEVKERVDL